MPPIFDTTTINRFEFDAESNFCIERPCIIDRIGLAIIAGTATYTLPAYISDIKRITYLGVKLWPLVHRDFREFGFTSAQQGIPRSYIINNIGQNKIQLFPTPNNNLADTTSAAGRWGADILTNCIIEFYRKPDQSLGYTIPDFMRRRLLKCYINKRCFEIDAKGVNLKNVKYWSEKFEMLKGMYIDLLDDLNNKPRKLIANDINSSVSLGSPVLPYRYGISVDK